MLADYSQEEKTRKSDKIISEFHHDMIMKTNIFKVEMNTRIRINICILVF